MPEDGIASNPGQSPDQSQPQAAYSPSQAEVQQPEAAQPFPSSPPSNTSGASQPTANKSKMLYIALIAIVAVLIAAAVALNNTPKTPTVTTNTITNNASQTSISATTTLPQNSYVLLSGIPLVQNMSDYYTFTTNATSINQYGLPFTKSFISALSLPSNYTLKIPQAYANVSSPIMVFISATTYPNTTLAESDYADLLKNITGMSTMRTSGPVNNSVIYHANLFGLSLIGVALRHGNTVSDIVTWGNPKTFTNSSYVSNMAIRQYAIISNKTQ